MTKLDVSLEVVIVSSNTDQALGVKALLEDIGYTKIDYIPNGVTALRAFEAKRYDIVFCDAETQQMDGWLLLREFKLSDKIENSPFIMMGVSPEPPCSLEELKEFGVLNYLPYPVEKDSIISAIRDTYDDIWCEGSREFRYSEAKFALIEHDGPRAVQLFEEIRQEDSGGLRSSMGLAQAYEKDEQYDKSQELALEIAERADDFPPALILQVKIAYERRDPKAAKALIRKILKETESTPQYFLQTAEISLSHKDYDLTESICRAAIERDYKMVEFYVMVAKAKYGQGDMEMTLALAEKAEKEYGASLDTYNIRGVVYRKSARGNDAIECYQNALKLSPMNPKVYFNLGLCQLAMGMDDQAKASFEMVVKIEPGHRKAKEKLEEMDGFLESEEDYDSIA